jgi:hypothetical protein
MWLKVLRSAVWTRGILSAGIAFVRVLNRLSSFGRYAFSSCLYYYAFPHRSNIMSRTGHQAVILKPYRAITNPLLRVQSVDSPFCFGVSLDDRVQGVDLGVIASSLSSTSGSFREALERISSSASLRYSPLSRPSFQRAYVAFARNSDLCLSFLRHCANYGERVFTWCLSFNASPTSSRVGAPHDLRERTARLLSEATGISTENVASVKGLSSNESTSVILYLSLTEVGTSVFCSPGSRRCKTTYKKASALEQKTTSELNTLFESLSSWVAVIDGPCDAPIDVVHPQELGELKCAWEKTRDFLRSALETLTSKPVHHHRSSLGFMHCRSALRRWMTSLACFS